MSINSLIKTAFGSGFDDIDWYWNHYYSPQKLSWPPQQTNEQPWTTGVLTYNPTYYPSQTVDKETGETIESISFDVPGLTAKDVKVSWDKRTRTLTLIGNNKKLGRTYTYTINTFSEDLLEDTLTTTVENGVATVLGKLRGKKEEEEEASSRVMDVAVKDGTAKPYPVK